MTDKTDKKFFISFDDDIESFDEIKNLIEKNGDIFNNDYHEVIIQEEQGDFIELKLEMIDIDFHLWDYFKQKNIKAKCNIQEYDLNKASLEQDYNGI